MPKPLPSIIGGLLGRDRYGGGDCIRGLSRRKFRTPLIEYLAVSVDRTKAFPRRSRRTAGYGIEGPKYEGCHETGLDQRRSTLYPFRSRPNAHICHWQVVTAA